MPQSQIAAQLYTVRDFTKTPEDIKKTLKKVREIGYEAVQLSALGPMDTQELASACKDLGLAVAATHTGFDQIRDNMDEVVKEHETLGCSYVAIGGLPQEYRHADGWMAFAKEATGVAQRLQERGLTFAYHNHSFELERFGERTGLDILYGESGPEFTAEIDTYWIQHGGGDPAAWISRVCGRSFLVHFKDMTMKGNQQIMAEVGEGNLNWPSILNACKDAGVIWYIVEQDTCQRDPFESLAISLKNLRGMGLH